MILRMLTGVVAFVLLLAKPVLKTLLILLQARPALRALKRLFSRKPKSVAERAAAWLADESGVGDSSLTIYEVMTGERRVPRTSSMIHDAMAGKRLYFGSWDAPHDADDFGRCARLLELVPEWVPRLGEVAGAYPPFRRLIRCWPELTALYERGETAMLSVVIKDLLGPGVAVRVTLRRGRELAEVDEHGNVRRGTLRLLPGTYDMERIRNPWLGHAGRGARHDCAGDWLVLKGTRVGAPEGSWRRSPARDDCHFDDESAIERACRWNKARCEEGTCDCKDGPCADRRQAAIIRRFHAVTAHVKI